MTQYIEALKAAYEELAPQVQSGALHYSCSPVDRSKRSATVDISSPTAKAQVTVWDSGECETQLLRRTEREPSVLTAQLRAPEQALGLVRHLTASCSGLQGDVASATTPEAMIWGVMDPESFLRFARALHADAAAGSPEWQSDTAQDFLEAAVAWSEDSGDLTAQPKGGSNPWHLFARFLLAGKHYE